MQLCVHLGAALSHSRGHIDVVLVRHLDAQLALPGLLGELLDDIGLTPPVAWKSPGKCRNAFTEAFLRIIAIQLFNATATALNCISQICCYQAALFS